MTTGRLYPDGERGMDESCANSEMLQSFCQVLEMECLALKQVCDRLQSQSTSIEEACAILAGTGRHQFRRVVVSGVGKAGLIARKVAATLSSTGTAATFLHPVEGLHGDLGFVRPEDAVLLFSYSGETIELVRLARHLERMGCESIAVTRSATNSLVEIATVCITTGDVEEACYLGLAPTSSTTVMLAIGDALALSVARYKGFREEDFARNHPAGSLGLTLSRADSVMRTGNRLVCVPLEMIVRQVVELVSDAKTGAAVLINGDNTLCGIFTDGDLRRALLNGGNVLEQPVQRFSSCPCHSLMSDNTLAEAMNLFVQTRTEDLPVVSRDDGQVVGLLCLKDIPSV
jgi:arabinose-5-phosphate isomerase